MRKRVLKAALMPVLVTGLFGYMSLFGSAETVTVTPEPRSIPHAALLLASHDCWTGPSPYGDLIPGHAVYRLEGQQAVYGPSQVGFDIWLHGVPGTLYGFCR